MTLNFEKKLVEVGLEENEVVVLTLVCVVNRDSLDGLSFRPDVLRLEGLLVEVFEDEV